MAMQIMTNGQWRDVPKPVTVFTNGRHVDCKQGYVLTNGIWKPIWEIDVTNYGLISGDCRVDRICGLQFDLTTGKVVAQTERTNATRWNSITQLSKNETWTGISHTRDERYFSGVHLWGEQRPWNFTFELRNIRTRERINIYPPTLSNTSGFIAPSDYDPHGAANNSFDCYTTFEFGGPKFPLYGAMLSATQGKLTTVTGLHDTVPHYSGSWMAPPNQRQFDWPYSVGLNNQKHIYMVDKYISFEFPNSVTANYIDVGIVLERWVAVNSSGRVILDGKTYTANGKDIPIGNMNNWGDGKLYKTATGNVAPVVMCKRIWLNGKTVSRISLSIRVPDIGRWGDYMKPNVRDSYIRDINYA